MSKIVFVLFVYDNDECSTGTIRGVYESNDDAQEDGELISEPMDVEYYVVARRMHEQVK